MIDAKRHFIFRIKYFAINWSVHATWVTTMREISYEDVVQLKYSEEFCHVWP